VRKNTNITRQSSYLIPKELIDATSNMAIDLPQKSGFVSATPKNKVPTISVEKVRKANNLPSEVRETMKTTTKEVIKPTSRPESNSSNTRDTQLPPPLLRPAAADSHRHIAGDHLKATANPSDSRAGFETSSKSEFDQPALPNYSGSNNGPLKKLPTSEKHHNKLKKKTLVASPSLKKREQEGKTPSVLQPTSSAPMSARVAPQPLKEPVADSVSQKSNSTKSHEEQSFKNMLSSSLNSQEYAKQASSTSKPISGTPRPPTSSNTQTISSETQIPCRKGIFQFQSVVPFVPCSDPTSPISSTPHPRSLEAKRRAGTLDIMHTSEELDAIIAAYHQTNDGLMGLGRFASLSLQPAYHAQLRHIASRGGRKGQYGEVLSVEELSARRARGWMRGQNKEWTDVAEGKDGVLNALGIPRAKNLEPVVEGGLLYLQERKATGKGMERKKWAWGGDMQEGGRGVSEMQARQWVFLAKKRQGADEEMIDV